MLETLSELVLETREKAGRTDKLSGVDMESDLTWLKRVSAISPPTCAVSVWTKEWFGRRMGGPCSVVASLPLSR